MKVYKTVKDIYNFINIFLFILKIQYNSKYYSKYKLLNRITNY